MGCVPHVINAREFTATFDGTTLTFSGDDVPGVYSPSLGDSASGAVVTHVGENFVALDTGWTLNLPQSIPTDGVPVQVPFVQGGDGSKPSAEALVALNKAQPDSFLTVTRQVDFRSLAGV